MLMFRPFIKYADFSGRASRSEYWLFQLFQILVYIALVAMVVVGAGSPAVPYNISAMMTRGMGMLAIVIIFALACFLPNLAVTTRRLHDTGRSAWWLLLYLPSILTGFMVGQQLASLQGHAAHAGYAGHAPMESFGAVTLLSLVGRGCNLVLFVMMCIRGNSGDNRFGPDPKGGSAADIARVFDEVDAQAEAARAAEPPHKPVFDFGPARGVPAVREAAPVPQRQASPPSYGAQPAGRATFGKRR